MSDDESDTTLTSAESKTDKRNSSNDKLDNKKTNNKEDNKGDNKETNNGDNEPDNIEIEKKPRRKWFSINKKSSSRIHSEPKPSSKPNSKPSSKPNSQRNSMDLGKKRNESSMYMEYYNGRKYKSVKGWNVALEIKCREIANECATFKWLHDKNALSLGDKLQTTTLIAAIISSADGVNELVEYIATNYYPDVVWIGSTMKLLGFIMSWVVAIILIIQKTYDFVDKIESHRNIERQHTWLFYDIQAQLQKNVKDRLDGNEYFKWITHELTNISDSSDIDDDVIKEFYKTFNDTKIPGLDTINELQVNMGDDDSSSSRKEKEKLKQTVIDIPNTTNLSNTANVLGVPSVSEMSSISNVRRVSNIRTSIPGSSNNGISEPSNRRVSIPEDTPRTKLSTLDLISNRLSPTRNPKKSADDEYIRQFREQRNMNVLSLGSTNKSYVRDSPHNPALMEYEMRRMGDDLRDSR